MNQTEDELHEVILGSVLSVEVLAILQLYFAATFLNS